MAIYADSMLFVLSTAILDKGFSLNSGMIICDAAIMLCKFWSKRLAKRTRAYQLLSGLAFYMSTKVVSISLVYHSSRPLTKIPQLIYYFLVEKVVSRFD